MSFSATILFLLSSKLKESVDLVYFYFFSIFNFFFLPFEFFPRYSVSRYFVTLFSNTPVADSSQESAVCFPLIRSLIV